MYYPASDPDPPDKLTFECQKIAKNLTFFQKNCQKWSCHGQFFFEKYDNFLAIFFEKNVKFLENFRHSNSNLSGVSGSDPRHRQKINTILYTFNIYKVTAP